MEVLNNYPVASEEFIEFDIESPAFEEDGGIRIIKCTETDPIVVK